jgi:hypothetical protein
MRAQLFIFLWKFRCVLFANSSYNAYLYHASDHLRSNVRTARMITEIFSKVFFASVRGRVASLNR